MNSPTLAKAKNGNGDEERFMHVKDTIVKAKGAFEPRSLPTDHPGDPLNWPYWQKIYVTALISVLALTAQLTGALPNPAFVPMSKDLCVTVVQASYTTTAWILVSGVSPMFLVPFANVYGRRILYIMFTVIAVLGNVGSAVSPTYGGVMASRVVSGLGSSIPLGIGAATICDLFLQGERGLFMGIYTVMVTNGPHVAPIAGGYITQRLGWRWCFWISAILEGGLWVICIFTLPETLFSRGDYSKLESRTYTKKLLFFGKVLDRSIRAHDFGTPFRMIKYVAVLLPCLYYCTANTYGSTIFAVTGSKIANTVYKFNIEQTGLFMGVPLTVGCLIGEATTGWVSDQLINAYARRHNGYRKPEVRLYFMSLAPLLCIGTAVYGYCIQQKKPWIDAAVAMAVSGVGTQIGTTMIYTYCTDSYKPQSGEIGAVVNLIKSTYAFSIGFYALPLSARIGYDGTFGICAAINGATLLLLLYLLFRGEKMRRIQGIPRDHNDL